MCQCRFELHLKGQKSIHLLRNAAGENERTKALISMRGLRKVDYDDDVARNGSTLVTGSLITSD
jgi:U3 small nucleolar RNA-associated protein 14